MKSMKAPMVKFKEIEPVQVSWSWVSQEEGTITWKFTNPNKSQVSFVLFRGYVQSGEDTPENLYIFGDAFYPLYYYDFGEEFQVGKPSPLSGSVSNPPLAVIESKDGKLQVGFIFTLKAGASFSMEEGGFVGIQPAGAKTISAVYSETGKFTINYSKQISCEQYNKQAGTDYPCPPNPFEVESAKFLISENVSEEVPSDVVMPVKPAPAPEPTPPMPSSTVSSSSALSACEQALLSAIQQGNMRDVISALLCIFENLGLSNILLDLEDVRRKL
jgi:hypothetical protein